MRRLATVVAVALLPLCAGAASPQAVHVGDEGLCAALRPFAERLAAARVASPDRFEPQAVRCSGSAPAASLTAEPLDVRGPNRSGVVTLRLALRDAAGGRSEARVTVRGAVVGPALVALETLARMETVAAGKVERREIEVTRLAGAPLRDTEQLAGRVPARTVGQGRVLTADLFQARPVVRRGETAEVTWTRGNLRVRLRGVLQRDGVPGETVSVRNPVSGALLQGIVQEDGSLEVSGRPRGE